MLAAQARLPPRAPTAFPPPCHRPPLQASNVLLTRDLTAKLGDVRWGWLGEACRGLLLASPLRRARLHVPAAPRDLAPPAALPLPCPPHRRRPGPLTAAALALAPPPPAQVGLSKVMTHTFASQQGGAVGTFAWCACCRCACSADGPAACAPPALLPAASPAPALRLLPLLAPWPHLHPVPPCLPQVRARGAGGQALLLPSRYLQLW